MNSCGEMMVHESLAEPLGWGMADPADCCNWTSDKTGNAKVQPGFIGDPRKKSTSHLRETKSTNPHVPVGW